MKAPVAQGCIHILVPIGLLDEIKRLLTGAKDDAETHAEGGEPVATPPGGEEERETSTNAQMMGSSDEPWSGND